MTDTMGDNLRLRAEWYALGRIEAESDRTGDPEGQAGRFGAWVTLLPMDGRTMHDRWSQFAHDSVHWHVTRHGEDVDPYVTYSVGAALAYAADEMERIADSEHDTHTICGEAGDFEESWKASERMRAYSNLAQNLSNLAEQSARPVHKRAPIYTGEDSGTRLAVAVQDVIRELYANGPDGFTVRECSHDECRPRPMGEGSDY